MRVGPVGRPTVCLILGCVRTAKFWFLTEDRGGRFMTASCGGCALKASMSVLGEDGRPSMRAIDAGEFLAAGIMESAEIMRAVVELSDGRLLYA